MALIKQRMFYGVPFEYSVIFSDSWSKDTNKTICSLVTYKDHAARIADVGSFAPDSRVDFTFDGELTRLQEYELIKQSNLIDGVEQNFWADAQNDV